MYRALLAASLLALSGCSGLFSQDDPFEFTGYTIIFTLDASSTTAGEPVGYTAFLVDSSSEAVEGLIWTLDSSLEDDLLFTSTALIPVVAGDHTITVSTDYEGFAYTRDAPLAVDAADPWALDLQLSDLAMEAGGSIGWEVSLMDIYGNDLDSSGATIEVDSLDVSVVGSAFQSIVPGTYLATATLDALDDVEPFVVVPGPPVDVEMTLSTTDLELRQTTTATVVVTDDYGNLTTDPWTITTSRPVDTLVSHRNISFFAEGWHTVTVTVDGTSLTDSVGPFLIDSTGPKLTITSPGRGAWRTSSTGTVSGTVIDDWSSVVDLTINGSPTTIGASGAFSKSMSWDWGTNVIETLAADSEGNSASDTRSLLRGSFRGYGLGVPHGIQVRINEGAGGTDTLESIGEALVNSYDLDDLIPWPLYEASETSWGVTWYAIALYVYNPSISGTTLDIDPRSNGKIRLRATIHNPHLDWWAWGVLIFIEDTESGSVDASSISVEVYATPSVSNGQIQLSFAPADVNAWITNFDFEWDSWLWTILEWFGVDAWIEDAVSNYMTDAIEDAVVDELAPVIEDALQDLELSYDFGLEGRTYTLEAEPYSIGVDYYGISLSLQTFVTVDSWVHPGWWGYGSLYRPYTPPYWPSSPKMNIAFSGDMLNQLFYAVWGGGMLDIEEDAAVLGLPMEDLEMVLPGVNSVTVRVKPLLPPVALPGSGNSEFELQIGDMEVTLFDGNPSANQVLVKAYVTAFADMDLTAVGDTSLSATVGQADVYFDVVIPDSNTLAAADTEALLGALVPLLLPMLTDAIGEIDIPSISGFGISGITISTGGSQNGYVKLGGNLYEQ
ncbi:MAG: hypothetical protein JRJ84_11615 [Deltaproteobacteria bacterium]|nr:hypothetical protein [Deltaproteobacteria bacterium]